MGGAVSAREMGCWRTSQGGGEVLSLSQRPLAAGGEAESYDHVPSASALASASAVVARAVVCLYGFAICQGCSWRPSGQGLLEEVGFSKSESILAC